MRRLLNTIWLLALCPLLMLGQSLQRYEYWVDEDYSQRKAVSSSSANITISLDIGSQTAGLHYLNFRSQNTDGDWSFLNRYLFYVPDQQASTASLKAYEYWIDDDYSARKRVSNSSGSYTIVKNLKDLTPGLHYLNFRAQNTDGDWSFLNRYLFYVPEAVEPTATLTAYEYWIDDDYSTRKQVTNSSGSYTIVKNVKDLAVGLHYLNFRTRNSRDEWGCLQRYLFYIPDEDPDAADGPIVAYRYNFNQVATYVPIDEQMSYQMNDFVIEIPELAEIGNLEKGCTFTFNEETNIANLVREQLVTFALQFQKKSGGLSVPVTTSFTMSDNLNRNILPLPLNGSLVYDKVPIGDFGAFRIDLEDEEALQLKANQACTIQLYDEFGYVMTGLCWNIDPKHSAAFALPDGIYYGVVYNMVKNDEYPKDQLKVKLLIDGFVEPVSDSDDLQDFIDGLGDDEYGTEEEPVIVPVNPDGLLVDGTTNIEDDLQLFIDGTLNTLAVSFNRGTIFVKSTASSMSFNNVNLISQTAAASPRRAVAYSDEGGIVNNGKLKFNNSTLDAGSYVITNQAGATIVLSSGTVVATNEGQIVNSGNVYLDGTVSVSNLQNKQGARIYVTSSLTKDITIVISDATDVEEKIPIILGAEGYTLTTADMAHVKMTLPEGYGRRYDKTAKAIILYKLAGLMGDVNNDTKVTITDAVGLVNCILGNPSAEFNDDAADVNQDGNITITDAVSVVNIILNNGEATAPAMESPAVEAPEGGEPE